ncbi:ParB/RepB/Spo0J family partition protein [Dokdonella sp.]|uniref:ParB/RepB/Spo0J family partition protein n=1 Tax=Dokdonella sp. TaxID=2291710 RepID=UPI00261E77D0|nr:ParB/RepB/Spo0J family partition protein [Dokdonella sp.]
MAAKKKGLGLGRGLDALLGGGDAPAAAATEAEGELRALRTGSIQAGKYQPRHHFDDERIEELAASIKAQGMIQPVVVRAIGPDRYELIAGERRWRAAQKAGLDEIPALVKEVPDQAVVAMALIENIQREDLSPLEEALALARLIDEFELTHQQAADAVGRSRASVSNLLRLLDLPEGIKRLLDERRLEMGHARALATVQPEVRAVALAREAADKEWSVRELEEAVRRIATVPIAANAGKSKPARDPNIDALERDLAEKLATRVSVDHSRNGRGKLVIHYHSLDELDGILERIR